MVKEYSSRRVKRTKQKRIKQKRTNKRIKQKRTNKRVKQKRTNKKRTNFKRTRSSRKQYPYHHIGGDDLSKFRQKAHDGDQLYKYILNWCLTVVPDSRNKPDLEAYCSICGPCPFDWLWCDKDLHKKIWYDQSTIISKHRDSFEVDRREYAVMTHMVKKHTCITNNMDRRCIPWRCADEKHIWDGMLKDADITDPANPKDVQIKINLVNIESKLKKQRRKYGLNVLDVGQDEPTETDSNMIKKYNGWIIPSNKTKGEIKHIRRIMSLLGPGDLMMRGHGSPYYKIQFRDAIAEMKRREKVKRRMEKAGFGIAGISAGVATAMLAPAVGAAIAPGVSAEAWPVVASLLPAYGAGAIGFLTGRELGEHQHVKLGDEFISAGKSLQRKLSRRNPDWVDPGPDPEPFSVDQGSDSEPDPELVRPDPEPVSKPDPEPVSKPDPEPEMDVMDVGDDGDVEGRWMENIVQDTHGSLGALARGDATMAAAPPRSDATMITRPRAPTSRMEP